MIKIKKLLKKIWEGWIDAHCRYPIGVEFGFYPSEELRNKTEVNTLK